MKINKILITGFLIASLIPALIIGVFGYQIAKKELYKQGIQDLEERTHAVIHMFKVVDEYVKNGKIKKEDSLKLIRRMVIGDKLPDGTRDYLNALHKGKISGIWFEKSDGTLIGDITSNEGKNMLEIATSEGKEALKFEKEIVTKKKGTVIYKWREEGKLNNYISVYNYYKPLDIIVGADAEVNEFLSPAKVIRNLTFLISLLAIIITLILSKFITNKISDPLAILTTSAGEIGNGNLALKIPTVKGYKEVELLANSFNTMTLKLKESYEGLEQKVIERTRDLDITNKQLQQANNAKSAFLASMSHELRTPLNAIIGFSELLKDGFLGELADEQKKPVENIYNSGKHLLTLINDILDLSKVEAGKVELTQEDTELPTLLLDSLNIIKERAMKHNIKLDSIINKEIGTVKVDSVRVKQIVYNLLSNAVKFTPDGGAVTLIADKVSQEVVLEHRYKIGFTDNVDNIYKHKEYIMISVKDTGIGIPGDKIDRLFKTFEQLHNTSLSKVEGTGLGLSLVKKLAQLHGGTVVAESEENKGSTFTVFIPFIPVITSEVQDEMNGVEPINISEHVYKALIIEDDANSASLLSKYLEDLAFHTEIAYNANEAIKALSNSSYDLITLDIFLPDKNGWDLLKELKAKELLNDAEIIVISIEPYTDKGMLMDVSSIIEKPVKRTEFVNIVNRLKLKRKRDIKNILVVDDDKLVLNYCKELLDNEFEVECALNGREALEKINVKKPDVLILDLLMPEVDGFDVVKYIKKDKKLDDIPIVIMTNKDITKEDLRLLNNRIESIIEKSKLAKEAFVDEIKRILHKDYEKDLNCR
jgi:signal transduction histidine kinase/CheY-like chemotaxis protein